MIVYILSVSSVEVMRSRKVRSQLNNDDMPFFLSFVFFFPLSKHVLGLMLQWRHVHRLLSARIVQVLSGMSTFKPCAGSMHRKSPVYLLFIQKRIVKHVRAPYSARRSHRSVCIPNP